MYCTQDMPRVGNLFDVYSTTICCMQWTIAILDSGREAGPDVCTQKEEI